MKYAKLWSAVMCAVLVPMFASQQASAGELSSCTSNCACTGETSLGYDSCTTISESELVDVSDPLALRQALGLTTVYNANTNKYEVSYDVSTPDTMILTLHSNGGQWATTNDLNDYLNALIFGPAGPPDSGLGAVNICELNDIGFLSQQGFFGRWDQSNNGWAKFQAQNVIYAAISDSEGDIYVDGEAFAPLSGTLQEQYCDDQTNADNVYTEQCSNYEDPKGSYGGGLEVCGDTVEGSVRQGPTAWTDLHNLKRDNVSFKIEEYWEQGQSGRQFRIRQVTETMRLRSDFFHAGVQQGGRKDSGLLSGQTELHQSSPGAANGVCSRGEVDEGAVQFIIDTHVGSAPSDCSFE